MQKYNILFIDDEPICHDVIRLVLSKNMQYNIISAYDGVSTISIIEKFNEKIDLIFLDIILPDIKGYALYKMLKSYDRFLDTPIVFQSGMSNNSNEIQEILQEKDVSILYKPYSNQILVKTIQDLIK